MKLAFIVMAYKDPSQIERLVRKMNNPAFDFYIHVDAKFSIAPFTYLREIDGVYLIQNRGKVRWAGYSFTKTLMTSAKEVFSSGRDYEFVSSISGQDYPIKSNEEIYSFYKNNQGLNFFHAEQFGSPWWEGTKQRVEQFHLTDFDFKGRHRLAGIINTVLPKRKFPLGYVLYGGSTATWWSMTRETLSYVIAFMEDNPGIEKFSRFTWAPDEYLLPTIIMNSPYREFVVGNNYRYVDWSLGGPNPKILTKKDFELIKNSNDLFARKFDIRIDTDILDLIDGITT